MVHLDADPQLSWALFFTSGYVRRVVVLGWALVLWLTITHPGEGQGDLGLALAGRLPLEGWEGTSTGVVTKAGTCTVLLVKRCSVWVQESAQKGSHSMTICMTTDGHTT